MAYKNGIEWSIRSGDGSSMVLEPEPKYGVTRLWEHLKGLVVGFVIRVWMFLKKAWDLGVDDPRKVFHSLKLGVALLAVSLFYYMRPLYDGVGGSAIWAVMTVVLVFEYTVGSLVSVSGYRVDDLLHLAHERFSTVVIGTCLCIITSMLIFPVWAGLELHLLILRNMDKIAKYLDCCVADYFGHGDEESKKSLQGYKCALNSKASEETMANFATWEPAHGQFSFRHPWMSYLKIGMSSRSCAYCIETLTSCLDSKKQVPESIKKHLESALMNLSTSSSNVIRELATVVSTMTRSVKINIAVEDMKHVPDLLIQPHDHIHKENNEVVSNETTVMPLLEVIPLVSFSSLLIEIASRIEENMLKTVEELAESAKFKQPEDEVKPEHNQTTNNIVSDEENMVVLQRV
ncbi:hypothetical protein L1987_72067 [Smallanthus sonchifolius]|uniref:Uncharacterized protein n=1 Tax=Smallanthus sonchifolius TaxID=185202 RepID=A0ACB9ATB5_9ASTR|nr:hypothetical protein L1987_72067 [Smallanthus sonchifolius]